MTVEGGHILPKDLYDFIAQRGQSSSIHPPSVNELMALLEENLPLYMQMIDPSLDGPAENEILKIFSSFNTLGVISIRPILLAMQHTNNKSEGMHELLKIVVRRIVVGNLGTGNIERRFSEAARNIKKKREWESTFDELRDLNPEKDEFYQQIRKRSFNKSTLTFLRRSIVMKDTTPDAIGFLHYICPRQSNEWDGFEEDDTSFWFNTLGNTILSSLERRPKGANNWQGFKDQLLPTAIGQEWSDRLRQFSKWDSNDVATIGYEIAEVACDVWY